MNTTEINHLRWLGEIENQEGIRPHLTEQEYNQVQLGC